MAESPWIRRVKHILQQVQASDATEVELVEGDFRVRVRRFPRMARAGVPEPSDQAAESEALHPVVTPLAGVFYPAPSPNVPPYVQVGDWVERNDVVGLIEAMKVFTEVKAECAGRVVRILAEAGRVVNVGDSLFLIDVSQRQEALERVQ